MENLRQFEKNPVQLDVKNLYHDSDKDSHRNLKIENSRWSSTNEQLRSSRDSNDHYTKINDDCDERANHNGTFNEIPAVVGIEGSNVHTGDSDRLNASNRVGNTYLTFSEDFPAPSNSDVSVIYSYATNDGQRAIRYPYRQNNSSGNSYLSLDGDSHDDYRTPNRNEFLGRIDEERNASEDSPTRYDNNSRLFRENGTFSFEMSQGNLLRTDHQGNGDTKNTYLVPRKGKRKREDIQAYFHKKEFSARGNNQQIGVRLAASGRSSYTSGRVSERSGKCSKTRIVILVVILAVLLTAAVSVLVLLLTKSDERSGKCSKTRIVILVVILAVLLTATVSVLALLLTKSDESIDDCLTENGCQSKCNRYPNVPNGHVNLTGELTQASSVQISCDSGFRVNGTGTAVCQNDGAWSVIFKCEPVDCGKYKPPEHVRLMEQEYETTVNATVNLACEAGFQFEKSADASVRCNEEGIWSGNPKCESLVDFSVQPSFILIGNIGKLSCNFQNIPNWQKVDFRRISSENNSSVIVSIDNLVDSYSTEIQGDNIKVTEHSFTHDSGEVVVLIDTVQCNDVFGIPGDVKYGCYVLYENSLTAFDERTIIIQSKASAPSVTISQQVVEGQDTDLARAFICEMYFPEPGGHIIIESDYDGENNTLLTTVNGEYETDGAWIEKIKTSVENCWYQYVVTFGLKSVSMKWHRKHIRCVARPADQSRDQTVFRSESGVVKVIPEDFCSGGKDFLPHPYNCSLFVKCDPEDTVKEVPAGCERNFCYIVDDSDCRRCDLVGGCSITDIYFKDGNTNSVGSSLTIVCIVEDFQGLEDIKIIRDNGELVSSLNTGDNIKGFRTLSNGSYLNATNGKLSLFVDHILCSDEAVYRCFPEGSGKPSDDVINLDLNC